MAVSPATLKPLAATVNAFHEALHEADEAVQSSDGEGLRPAFAALRELAQQHKAPISEWLEALNAYGNVRHEKGKVRDKAFAEAMAVADGFKGAERYQSVLQKIHDKPLLPHPAFDFYQWAGVAFAHASYGHILNSRDESDDGVSESEQMKALQQAEKAIAQAVEDYARIITSATKVGSVRAMGEKLAQDIRACLG